MELIAKAMRGPETWKSVFISVSGLIDDKVKEQKGKIEALCHIRTERLQIACSLLSEAIIRACHPKILKNITFSPCLQHGLLGAVSAHCTNLETLQLVESSCDTGIGAYPMEMLQYIARSFPMLKELFFELKVAHHFKKFNSGQPAESLDENKVSWLNQQMTCLEISLTELIVRKTDANTCASQES